MLSSTRLQDTALRYFLEVVRSGSVSEAATRLNVSPSAVSRQVAALEDLLGVPLFDRRPRGMAPSAAGELLAAHARRGALEADRVVSDIQALQGLRTGLVRICSSAGFAIEFLPRVMAQFRPGGATGPGGHIRYSPWCVPTTLDGAKCVVVNRALREHEPMAWDFVMNFAKDNELQVVEACLLPDTNP